MASFDDLLRRKPEALSLKQRFALGVPPATLRLEQLVYMWVIEDETCMQDAELCKRYGQQLWARMRTAVALARLPAKVDAIKRRIGPVEPVFREGSWMLERGYRIEDIVIVHRDDFRRWLEQENLWPLPPKSPLSKWWCDSTGESKPPRRRKDALDDAIDDAERALHKELGRNPNSDEVFEYLRTRDESGTILDQKPEGLVWLTRDGKTRTIRHSSLAKRLTRRRGKLR